MSEEKHITIQSHLVRWTISSLTLTLAIGYLVVVISPSQPIMSEGVRHASATDGNSTVVQFASPVAVQPPDPASYGSAEPGKVPREMPNTIRLPVDDAIRLPPDAADGEPTDYSRRLLKNEPRRMAGNRVDEATKRASQAAATAPHLQVLQALPLDNESPVSQTGSLDPANDGRQSREVGTSNAFADQLATAIDEVRQQQVRERKLQRLPTANGKRVPNLSESNSQVADSISPQTSFAEELAQAIAEVRKAKESAETGQPAGESVTTKSPLYGMPASVAEQDLPPLPQSTDLAQRANEIANASTKGLHVPRTATPPDPPADTHLNAPPIVGAIDQKREAARPERDRIEANPVSTPVRLARPQDPLPQQVAMAPFFPEDQYATPTLPAGPAATPSPIAENWIEDTSVHAPSVINHRDLFSHSTNLQSMEAVSTWPCSTCGQVMCCCPNVRWTARGEALLLHRSRANGFGDLFVRCVAEQTGVRSQDIPMDFRGGPLLTVARQNLCGGLDFEGSYYLLDSWSGEDSHFGDLIIRETERIGVGTAFVRSESRLQNVEFNVTKHLTNWTKFLIGFRYLSLDEFASIDATTNTTPDFHEDVTTGNDLYGGQVGLRKTLWDRGGFVTIDGTIKGGVFQNNIHRTTNGFGTTPLDDEVTSFVGELGVVMDYQISSHWSASLGYQALWITHVAQAIDQFNSESQLFSDETAILHGLRMGLEFGW